MKVDTAMIRNYQGKLGRVDIAKFCARMYFLSGYAHYNKYIIDAFYHFDRLKAHIEHLQIMYVAGCEMEGYGELWTSQLSDYNIRAIVHKARVAALQTLVVLRQRGVVRDVAIVIAKIVYQSKNDAYLWYVSKDQPRKRIKK